MTPEPRGLDRIEKLLFLGGVLAFALLILLFGQPLGDTITLPIVVAWVALGVGFVWWFDRHLAHRRE